MKTSSNSKGLQQTLFAADSPVLTPLATDLSKESRALIRVCGLNSYESFARFCRDTCSWKTSQIYLSGEWESFSGAWPKAGTMQDGCVYQRASLQVPNGARECSLLPTLVAGDSKAARNGTSGKRETSSGLTFTDWLKLAHGHTCLHPCLAEQVMGFPIGYTDLEPSATP